MLLDIGNNLLHDSGAGDLLIALWHTWKAGKSRVVGRNSIAQSSTLFVKIVFHGHGRLAFSGEMLLVV